MTKDELIDELNEFVNQNGLWDDFIQVISEKGYSENEVDVILKQLKW